MAAAPSFIGTPRAASVSLSAANTARNGTGTITELIAGVAAGTRVLEVVAKCSDDSAVACVNIFHTTDGGTTWRLLSAIDVSLVNVGVDTDSFEGSVTFDNLILVGTNHRLGVASTVAQATNVFAFGGDL